MIGMDSVSDIYKYRYKCSEDTSALWSQYLQVKVIIGHQVETPSHTNLVGIPTVDPIPV